MKGKSLELEFGELHCLDFSYQASSHCRWRMSASKQWKHQRRRMTLPAGPPWTLLSWCVYCAFLKTPHTAGLNSIDLTLNLHIWSHSQRLHIVVNNTRCAVDFRRNMSSGTSEQPKTDQKRLTWKSKSKTFTILTEVFYLCSHFIVFVFKLPTQSHQSTVKKHICDNTNT